MAFVDSGEKSSYALLRNFIAIVVGDILPSTNLNSNRQIIASRVSSHRCSYIGM